MCKAKLPFIKSCTVYEYLAYVVNGSGDFDVNSSDGYKEVNEEFLKPYNTKDETVILTCDICCNKQHYYLN